MVIRSFGSYVIFHCLIFYWHWPVSIFSDIAFMQLSSERDRLTMHGPFGRSASPHVDLVLQDANPRAFPFCPQWPCRIWDVLHEFWHLELHECWSFLDTFKFVLWSNFGAWMWKGFCMIFHCAMIGTRNFHDVMSHNFNSVLFSLNSQFSQSARAFRLSWHMNEYLFVRVAQDFLFGCKISYLAFFQNFNQRQRQKEALSCRPWDLVHNRLNNLWDLIVDMDLLLVTSIFSYLITTCE